MTKFSISQSLLTEEQEAQLMKEMRPLWLRGMPAEVGGIPCNEGEKKLTCTQIAQALHFGEPTIKVIDQEGKVQEESNPYAKLKVTYIPYYRLKFEKKMVEEGNPGQFPIRQKPRFDIGEQRYKVSPTNLMNEMDIMNPLDFIELLNNNVPKIDSFYYRRCRSFLLVIYYTPLRSSEIYERVIDDFEINENEITIHLMRKKKRSKKTKDQPIDIPRVFPLVEEIVSWLQGEEWKLKTGIDKTGEEIFNSRPWMLGRETARNYAKELNQDVYPHFFRFNFVTSELNYPDTSIADLQSKTVLTLTALEKYSKSPKRVQKGYDQKRIKRFKKMGVIK